MSISEHAQELLLSARRSAKGSVLLGRLVPAAVRELRDHGLINSHYKLTGRGALEHQRAAAAQDPS